MGPGMIATIALAVVLSQSAPEQQLSSHVLTNLRCSLTGSSSSAVVTVMGVAAGRVKLRVDLPVVGELPEELDVPAKTFIARDLQSGTQLLVFFRGKQAPVPTGHYELVWDGKIREYPMELYLDRTRQEATKVAKPAPKPKAPPQQLAASAPGRAAGR